MGGSKESNIYMELCIIVEAPAHQNTLIFTIWATFVKERINIVLIQTRHFVWRSIRFAFKSKVFVRGLLSAVVTVTNMKGVQDVLAVVFIYLECSEEGRQLNW